MRRACLRSFLGLLSGSGYVLPVEGLGVVMRWKREEYIACYEHFLCVVGESFRNSLSDFVDSEPFCSTFLSDIGE